MSLTHHLSLLAFLMAWSLVMSIVAQRIFSQHHFHAKSDVMIVAMPVLKISLWVQVAVLAWLMFWIVRVVLL